MIDPQQDPEYLAEPVEEDPPSRQPHLGYAIPFAASAFLLFNITALIFFSIGIHIHRLPADAISHTSDFPKLSLVCMVIGYLSTLGLAIVIYPKFWNRPFWKTLNWNFDVVRRHWQRIVSGAIALSLTVSLAQQLIKMPKEAPMDNFFRTPFDVWLIILFGTFLAPLMEELAFRGFLLPAIAIAFDWLRLKRTPEAEFRWRSTTTVTAQAFLFSAILTSIGFAFVHASQLAHAWGAVFILFCVSLVLTAVRIRLNSLAASTLLHSCYNFSIFVMLIIATGGLHHLDKLKQQ